MSAEIVELAAKRKPPNPGNGAREAILAWLEAPPVTNPVDAEFFSVSADALLAWLWTEGFKVVPLEAKDGNYQSSGDKPSDCASVQAIVRLFQEQPGLQNFQCWPCMVSRDYLVPYLAGRSADGFMTYIDQGVPQRLKMGIEPDKYIACHEGLEWWLMTRLDKAYWLGPSAKSAHWWATGYEHMDLKMDGWLDDDIAAYEAELAGYVSESEAERISPELCRPIFIKARMKAQRQTTTPTKIIWT